MGYVHTGEKFKIAHGMRKFCFDRWRSSKSTPSGPQVASGEISCEMRPGGTAMTPQRRPRSSRWSSSASNKGD